MGVYERKRDFERNPPAVRERALVRFAGADGFDVYNCSAAFVFDPAAHRATAPRIVATRAMHAPAPCKVPHLDDCAFTSGFDFRPDGLVDVWSGLGDAAEGRLALDAANFW